MAERSVSVLCQLKSWIVLAETGRAPAERDPQWQSTVQKNYRFEGQLPVVSGIPCGEDPKQWNLVHNLTFEKARAIAVLSLKQEFRRRRGRKQSREVIVGAEDGTVVYIGTPKDGDGRSYYFGIDSIGGATRVVADEG